MRDVILDGAVRLLKVRPLAELAGALARPGQRSVGVEEMDAAIAAGAGEGSEPPA